MFPVIEVMLLAIQSRMIVKAVRSARNNQTIQTSKQVAKLSYFRTLVIASNQTQNLGVQIRKSKAIHTRAHLLELTQQTLCYKIKKTNLSHFTREIPKKLLIILKTTSLDLTFS